MLIVRCSQYTLYYDRSTSRMTAAARTYDGRRTTSK